MDDAFLSLHLGTGGAERRRRRNGDAGQCCITEPDGLFGGGRGAGSHATVSLFPAWPT